jgi:hypothetical protein
MLELQCTCGTVYRVAEEQAGRRARCKACNAVMIVPRVIQPARPSASQATPEPDENPFVVETVKDYAPRRTMLVEVDEPIVDRSQSRRPVPTQTVEQTGKMWKFWMLMGGLGFVVSTVLYAQGDDRPLALKVAAASVVVWVVARVGAWWFHG